MKNIIKTMLSLFVISLFFLTPNANAAELRTVSVTGQAEKKVAPDTAYIVLGVVTQSTQVEDARSENAAKINNIVRNLAEFGISKNSIKTKNFTVNPVYERNDYQERKIVAYNLENVLIIETKDLNKIGSIIDSAFRGGSNRLDGIQFTHSNVDAIQKSMIKEAVQDGYEKAKLVLSASGNNVGNLVNASLNSSNTSFRSNNYELAGKMASDVTSEVFVGDITVSASVNLVYEIG